MLLFRHAHPLGRLLPLLFLALTARAQRTDGPPTTDPFARRPVPAQAVPGGRYQSHAFANGTLTVRATDGSTLCLRPWAEGVLNVSYFAPGRRPIADSSVSVVQAPGQWPAAAQGWHLVGRETAQALVLGPGHGQQTLVIYKNPLRVALLQGADTVLCEAVGAGRRVAAAPTAATEPGPGGTAVGFRLAPGERLYGTGSRALPLDRRGYRLELYNQAHYGSQNHEPNLNITLPVVLSSRGYLLLFDHYAAGYLDLGKTDQNVLEYGGEGLTSLSYFVVTGRGQAEILDRYTALTGRQPLPPRWALGLIQSRFGYKSAAEMNAVAARMRRENFPLDALVLDLYWFGGTTKQGDLAWDSVHFPDPPALMAGLKRQGVNTILISEPYVMRTSRNDSAVRAQGLVGTDAQGRPFTVGSFWAGPASILDVFKPSARRWLWHYYQTLHDQGVAGWWSDLGEPENHPAAMRHVLGPARAVHNAYGQAWAGIFQENYARQYPNERVFNLARSGWAGMQRNSVFPWSGDINRSWSGFQAQVPVMLGLGQAGVGYMHSDAGGFCVGPIDPELYTRWLQMASLCPILRIHGEGVPPEPYFFPNPYKSAVREATHLRYELLPYLYALAYANSLTGAPLVAPTDFVYQPLRTQPNQVDAAEAVADATAAGFLADELAQPAATAANPALANRNDQYFLGPNLLVAPVLSPSQRRRNVTLPAGPWIDFYTNEAYPGGQTVAVPAPLAHAPLLVRAGAFVPLTAYRPTTAQYRPDTLLLRYYPDAAVPATSFTAFDDDGHSAQALAQHQYQTLAIYGTYHGAFWGAQPIMRRGPAGHERRGPIATVRLRRTGHYPGQPTQQLVRLLVQRVAAPPASVQLGGRPAPANSWAYDAARHELAVAVPLADTATVQLLGLRLLATAAPLATPDPLTLEGPDQRSFGPGGTTLHFSRLVAGAPELLQIRDARGALVRQLVLDGGAPGPHALAFDGRDGQGRPLPSGVYTAEVAGQHQRLVLTE